MKSNTYNDGYFYFRKNSFSMLFISYRKVLLTSFKCEVLVNGYDLSDWSLKQGDKLFKISRTCFEHQSGGSQNFPQRIAKRVVSDNHNSLNIKWRRLKSRFLFEIIIF